MALEASVRELAYKRRERAVHRSTEEAGQPSHLGGGGHYGSVLPWLGCQVLLLASASSARNDQVLPMGQYIVVVEPDAQQGPEEIVSWLRITEVQARDSHGNIPLSVGDGHGQIVITIHDCLFSMLRGNRHVPCNV